MVRLELVPLRGALLAWSDNTLDALLRVQSCSTSPGPPQRLRLNLALVIDRSGSMAGEALEEARRCAALIIGRLAPEDRAALVAYDNEAQVLVPARPVDDREAFMRAIDRIGSGDMTALHAGWATGAEQAARGVSRQVVSRVLLLSDGMANVGVCSTSVIADHCAQMAEAGVGTSTYGLGTDFNEELLTQMARAGEGNAYYCQSPADLEDPFREELELLSALCARGLRLSLTPAPGVQIEVLNQYHADAQQRFLLPDLPHGGEAWALLRLTVPAAVVASSGPGDIHLLSAMLAYSDLTGEHRRTHSVHLRLPTAPANVYGAIALNERVTRRITELEAASLQEQGREAARRNDWPRVDHLLAQLGRLAHGNPWLTASVERLEHYARRRESAQLAKESLYTSSVARRRLIAEDEALEWSEAAESRKPAYLRRKSEQGRAIDPPDDASPPADKAPP